MLDIIRKIFKKKEENVVPAYGMINIFKNKKLIARFSSSDNERAQNICNILMFFQKYEKYQIITDLVSKEINVYFTTTPAKDVDADVFEK